MGQPKPNTTKQTTTLSEIGQGILIGAGAILALAVALAVIGLIYFFSTGSNDTLFPQEFVVTNSTEYIINADAAHSDVLWTLGEYRLYPSGCRFICSLDPGMTATGIGYTDSENSDKTYVVHAWDVRSGLTIYSKQFEREKLEESGWVVEIVDMWGQ
jgi:hypothetical protein